MRYDDPWHGESLPRHHRARGAASVNAAVEITATRFVLFDQGWPARRRSDIVQAPVRGFRRLRVSW